jgi:hypothetical protein
MATSDDKDTKRDVAPPPAAEKTAGSSTSECATDVMVHDAIPVAASPVATPMATADDALPGRLLNREDSADILGVSVTTFRRRYEDIVVAPVMQKGVHLFREVKIREIAIRERRERFLTGDAPADPDKGKLTAVVFELLDQGVTPIDIVKRLERPGPEIEELHAQWARMRGTVVLTGEQIEKLRSLDWTGSKPPPIESGARLVHFIQDLSVMHDMEARNCAVCHATRAQLCAACARIQVERIRAETRRQAEEARADIRCYVEDAKTERAHSAAKRRPEARAQRRGTLPPTPPEDDEKGGRGER